MHEHVKPGAMHLTDVIEMFDGRIPNAISNVIVSNESNSFEVLD